MSNTGVYARTYANFSAFSSLILALYIGSGFGNFQFLIDSTILGKWYLTLFLIFLMGGTFLFSLNWRCTIDAITFIVFFCSIALSIVNIANNRLFPFISSLGFLVLYNLCRTISKTQLKTIKQFIVIVCFIQASFGLLQYFNIVETSSNFKIVGSFDNPAGFASYVVIGVPFSFLTPHRIRELRYLSYICGIVMIAAVILSQSRTGIFCLIVEGMLVTVLQLRLRTKKLSRKSCLVIAAISLSIILILLKLKKASTIGRGFIWYTTLLMTENKVISGGGPGSFTANYMLYQAYFFNQNPKSSFSIVADNTNHPFNEFLIILVEYGIAGILLCFLVIVKSLSTKKLSDPISLSLISILIFACFSYPLRYPFTWVSIAVYLGVLSRNNRIIYAMSRRVFVSLIGVILISGTYFLIKDFYFELRWKQIAEKALQGKTVSIIHLYRTLMNNWNGNPYFLYNYAAELNYIEKYQESSRVLSICKNYLNDYDVQMLAADNYKNLHNLNRAEKCLKLASLMIPSRFRPLKSLLEIYNKTGNLSKVISVCKTIKHKPVKVTSNEIQLIKSTADSILLVNKCSVE